MSIRKHSRLRVKISSSRAGKWAMIKGAKLPPWGFFIVKKKVFVCVSHSSPVVVPWFLNLILYHKHFSEPSKIIWIYNFQWLHDKVIITFVVFSFFPVINNGIISILYMQCYLHFSPWISFWKGFISSNGRGILTFLIHLDKLLYVKFVAIHPSVSGHYCQNKA